MSDTQISDSTPHNVADLGMLCRTLERQLTAANVELEEKRKDIVYLATEKAKLEDRIKRLEEAGDKMEPWCSEYGPIYRWRKAKEAKL